jgi:hypothetical protein
MLESKKKECEEERLRLEKYKEMVKEEKTKNENTV